MFWIFFGIVDPLIMKVFDLNSSAYFDRLVKFMEWLFQGHNLRSLVFSLNKGHVLKTSGRNGL